MSHTTPTYCVYLVTNTVTGKQYVGVTTDAITKRLYWHSKVRTGSLYPTILEYGVAAFTIVCLSTHDDKEDALAEEARQIVALDTHMPSGYNRQVRGGRYPGRGGPKPGNTNSRRTPVRQCTRLGHPMRTWPTVTDAAKALGIQRNTIHRAMSNPSYTAAGYRWQSVQL